MSWFKKKKRVIKSPLVCLFCSDVDPNWFTEENIDAVPSCTACNLHLVPADLKSLLTTGSVPENLRIDKATALTAVMSVLPMLWAYLEAVRGPLSVKSRVSWDVWNPEAYANWPEISQSSFTSTFGDAAHLGCEDLGSLTSHFPYLVMISSNLMWRVDDQGSEGVEVYLWPKDAMGILNPANFEALVAYLEQVRPSIAEQPLWFLIDRMLEMVGESPVATRIEKLVGVEVQLHTFGSFSVFERAYFKDADDYQSKELLVTKPGTVLATYGPDVPKRLFQNYIPNIRMSGPFDLKVEVVHSSESDQKLTLVHGYSFKLLVSAETPEQAESIVRTRFFEKSGFTLMSRAGQHFLLDEQRGVDWDREEDAPVRESSLYSKLVQVKATTPDKCEGTAWQSLCI